MVGRCGLDSSGYVTVAGSCEHGNEPSGSKIWRGISSLAE
jgi:hypothetical protein